MVCNFFGWLNVGEEFVECLLVGSLELLVIFEEIFCCFIVRCLLLLYFGDFLEEWVLLLK